MQYSDEMIAIVRNTAYGEWNKYIEYLEKCGPVDNFMELINPDLIRDIILNAHKNISDLGMEIIKSIYKERYTYLSDTDKYRYMPSVDIQNYFSDSLIADHDRLAIVFDNYILSYTHLLNKVQSAKSLKRSWGGAAIGGAIGLIFGPIGAVIGGVTASALSDEKASDELSIQLEITKKAWIVLADGVNCYLQEMVSIMSHNIDTYSYNVGY